MKLSGSCLCQAVTFELESTTPYPYQYCYCSICRKSNGGGGYAVNIKGNHEHLKVHGQKFLYTYRHPAKKTENGGSGKSENRRRFCSNCGSFLWCYNPKHDPNCYPFASVIDTELPKPPERFHIMLKYQVSWINVPEGPNEHHFETYADLSIREWHEKRDLLMD